MTKRWVNDHFLMLERSLLTCLLLFSIMVPWVHANNYVEFVQAIRSGDGDKIVAKLPAVMTFDNKIKFVEEDDQLFYFTKTTGMFFVPGCYPLSDKRYRLFEPGTIYPVGMVVKRLGFYKGNCTRLFSAAKDTFPTGDPARSCGTKESQENPKAFEYTYVKTSSGLMGLVETNKLEIIEKDRIYLFVENPEIPSQKISHGFCRSDGPCAASDLYRNPCKKKIYSKRELNPVYTYASLPLVDLNILENINCQMEDVDAPSFLTAQIHEINNLRGYNDVNKPKEILRAFNPCKVEMDKETNEIIFSSSRLRIWSYQKAEDYFKNLSSVHFLKLKLSEIYGDDPFPNRANLFKDCQIQSNSPLKIGAATQGNLPAQINDFWTKKNRLGYLSFYSIEAPEDSAVSHAIPQIESLLFCGVCRGYKVTQPDSINLFGGVFPDRQFIIDNEQMKTFNTRLEDSKVGGVAGAISNNPNLLKTGIIGHIRGAQQFLRVRSVIRKYVEESLIDVMADDSQKIVEMTTAIIMASNFKYQK